MEEPASQGFTDKLRRLIKRTEGGGDTEVLAAVDEFKKQGYLEEDEAEMISNVMEMSDTKASDIMTHRTKLVAISDEETVESALRIMLEENHTRYPLYAETVDDIRGMLYIKDLMIAYMNGHGSDKVETAAREALFVPDTMPIDSLFETLREKRTHIAVVVDEYGQTAGVVGMEDIIEEIVGEILDEYDEEESQFVEKPNGEYSVQPDTRLEELEEMTGIKIAEEELENFDTVNGLLVYLLGHIPEKGEKAELEYAGFLFKVYSEEGRMISQVTVIKKSEEESKPE